jgi:predicted nuclease of restriction endonuclease-like (RecB) superfamily
MKFTTFYTIKELDYKTIESRLLSEKISSELKNEILHLISDHKAMIECRKKIIEDQNFYTSALFQLFAEPVVAAQTEENNPTDKDHR